MSNASNKELVARVRYIEGNPEDKKTGQWDDNEQFVIETWDNEYEEWCYDTGCELVHSKEYPGAGPQFLHFSILKRLMQLADLGYSFQKAKSNSRGNQRHGKTTSSKKAEDRKTTERR